MPYAGEGAGLLTAVLWSFTAVFFTLATRRVGVLAVNLVRLSLAVVLLSSTTFVLSGTILPVGAGPGPWLWLGLSGVVGLTVGDSFLFASLEALGPRKAMLLMATSPILTAGLALAFFGERPTVAQAAGILLTVGGVALVVAERAGGGQASGGLLRTGVLLGLGASVCQALGLLAAKQGLAGGFSSLDGTLIRMVVATGALGLAVLIRGKLGEVVRSLRADPGALRTIGAGAVTGPYLGVWMSLFAVSHAKAGVAAALMQLVPVFLIPITRFAFGEPVTGRAVLGTAAAFSGSILLF